MSGKNQKLNGQSHKPWVKPTQDPLVKDVSHIMKNHPEITNAYIARRTGLVRKTIVGIRHLETMQPHPTTLRMILRCYDKEIVIRDIGSNE